MPAGGLLEKLYLCFEGFYISEGERSAPPTTRGLDSMEPGPLKYCAHLSVKLVRSFYLLARLMGRDTMRSVQPVMVH
jgi:hypothetical protein